MNFDILKKTRGKEILTSHNISLDNRATDKLQAIKMAGELLYSLGYVEKEYIEAMVEREKDITTYIGNGVAIPHGVGASKKYIKSSGITILQFPEGVSFGDEIAYLIVGIAGINDEHIGILSNIATLMLEREEEFKSLWFTKDKESIYELFTAGTF